MAISLRPYVRALYESAEGKSKAEVRGLVDNFLKILLSKQAISRSQEVLAEVERLDDEANHRLRAHITSAHRLDEETLAKIERAVKQRTNAKEIVWEKEVDHSILGGAVIRYGDTILDFSMAQSLNALVEEIKK